MIPIQVRLTKRFLDIIDRMIDDGIYANRSEAIRDCIRKACNEHKGRERKK